MTKLPQVTAEQVVKALRKVGFTLNRWHGSHAIMERWGEIISVLAMAPKQLRKEPLAA
jgi:predicted RNA binding protein YcfA (HicA-like mRNA interferase family)